MNNQLTNMGAVQPSPGNTAASIGTPGNLQSISKNELNFSKTWTREHLYEASQDPAHKDYRKALQHPYYKYYKDYYDPILQKSKKWFEHEMSNKLDFSDNSKPWLEHITNRNEAIQDLYKIVRDDSFLQNPDDKKLLKNWIERLATLDKIQIRFNNRNSKNSKIQAADYRAQFHREYEKLNDWLGDKVAHFNKYKNEQAAANKIGISNPLYLLKNPGLFGSNFAGKIGSSSSRSESDDSEERRKEREMKMILGMLGIALGIGKTAFGKK